MTPRRSTVVALLVLAVICLAVSLVSASAPGGPCGSLLDHQSDNVEVGPCSVSDWDGDLGEVVAFGVLGLLLLVSSLAVLLFRTSRDGAR